MSENFHAPPRAAEEQQTDRLPVQRRYGHGRSRPHGPVSRYVRDQWATAAPTHPIKINGPHARPVMPQAPLRMSGTSSGEEEPSTTDSSAWQEFRNWSKKGRWRRFVFGSVVTFLIIGVISGQVPTVGAAVEYGITKVTEPGAFERNLPDDLKSGVRVVDRDTTLDLSGWRPTTVRDLDVDRKVSRGLSLTSFLLQKTDPGAKYFVHTVSSDSKTAPSIWCDSHPFRIVEANGQAASSTRQWNVLVDISQEPDDRPFTINLVVTFWNGFQTRESWWSGFRVLHSTETATYRVIFPSELPVSDIKFRYKDITGDKLVDLDQGALEISPKPLKEPVQTLTWRVKNPQPDRSYRIFWSWPDRAVATE